MLNDDKIQLAEKKKKGYKIKDSRYLYLHISPEKGKWWYFYPNFESNKKEKYFLGTHPRISLLKARELEARELGCKKLFADALIELCDKKQTIMQKADEDLRVFRVDMHLFNQQEFSNQIDICCNLLYLTKKTIYNLMVYTFDRKKELNNISTDAFKKWK